MHGISNHSNNTLKPAATSRMKLSLEVLLVDRDALFLTLLGNILKTFGIDKIHYANSGETAKEILLNRTIDLVMSEWPMGIPNEASTIAEFMRNSEGAPFQQSPLIVITSQDRISIVNNSRDRGISEFLLKPVRVPKLCQRIRSVIENPREYIFTSAYCGPDRRRKSIPISSEVERRMPAEEIKERSRREENKTIIALDDQDITLFDKDFGLLKKIGQAVNLDDIFSPELIEEAQAMVTNKENEYMSAASEDMIWLTNALKQLTLDPNNIQILQPMAVRVQAIKEKSGIFGFHMAVSTTMSLLKYLAEIRAVTDEKLIVIKEHVDVLMVVFHKRIQGTGGDTGHQLTHYIEKMKMRHPAS